MIMYKSFLKKVINYFGFDISRVNKDESFRLDNQFYNYKDKHKNERCVIIGNGPSINKTNLELVEKDFTFGQNKFFLYFDQISFVPTYMVSYIPDVINQSVDEFLSLSMPLFVSFDGRLLLQDRNYETYHFGPFKRFIFSLDPAKEICVGHTVTYVTLQLALYMGFHQVILVGVDHDFNYNGPTDKWHVIEKPMEGRHFIDNYFSPGQTWQSPNLKAAEIHYSFAKGVYEELGREIIDCTVDGKLDVFKKSTLEEIL